jgi:hypothetical protein
VRDAVEAYRAATAGSDLRSRLFDVVEAGDG